MAARFDAFISYSRSASSTLAVELRNGIERFAKPWYRLRSSRVFLDDASMSANTGLWSTIERGLTEAEWFILICSPKAAESQYVTTEITWWLQHKSADRILLVLDEGTMLWDAKAGDFDWKRSSAVNRALSKAFAEEPRWVEMPWFEAEGSLGTADPRFPERVADLASAVRGLERDELIGENVRQRRRALRLLRGGVIALSGLLIASLVATVIAVVNGNAAAEQARIALARQLAAQAITLSATDLQTASLLAVEAQRMNDDAQTRAALFQLATASPQLVRSLPVGSTVTATALAADGTVFTGDEDGTVVRWDGSERVDLADLNARVSGLSVSDDGAYVAAAMAGDEIRVVTPAGDAELTVPPPPDPDFGGTKTVATLAAISPDGAYLAVTNRSDWLTLFERGSDEGETTYTPIGTVPFGGRVGWGDGELTTFMVAGRWARIALRDASVLDSGTHTLGISANGFAISGDGRVLAGSPAKSVNYSVWDTAGSVSGGGDVPGDPADRVATSQIAGSLDLALDESGSRLAVMDDGVIYISRVRAASELPEIPTALLGAGEVTGETLAFRGDTVVNGTGEFALVWDLTQTGRISTEFASPVPDGCSACGPPLVAVGPDGDRALMWSVGGGSPVLVDLATQQSTVVDGAGEFGLTTAAWWDADEFLVSSMTRQVVFLVGAETLEATRGVPLPFADGVTVLALHGDPRQGRVTALGDDGSLAVVTLDGTVITHTEPFADLLSARLAYSYGISPDGATAFVYKADSIEGGLRMVSTDSGATLYENPGLTPALYDGRSRLHLFADGRETVLDGSGSVVLDRPADAETRPMPSLSSDGDLLAGGGPSGLISLLDLARGGVVVGRVPVPVEDNRLPVTAFRPDGTALFTAIPSMDGLGRAATVSVLTLVPDEWRRSACAVAGRDLSAEEWSAYVGTAVPADLGCGR
ncbi:MAG TPA: toll/interleukin-1 receptor domain-containing protein [Pseudolysinimonas sp.]|nr:toll/interleukin-1 receptor domain-containing protein [Pseudolysinimonas sp.]